MKDEVILFRDLVSELKQERDELRKTFSAAELRDMPEYKLVIRLLEVAKGTP